ncbi:WD40 repeat domain-containing protein [Horticoccus sp. 23ND18S-11]|uniref:WD40 repeat domain-containing protein n=1 Tax=Horticoccus sp. 23ND18S-11 TaxID=3391832 RepID=UPI0039C92CAC
MRTTPLVAAVVGLLGVITVTVSAQPKVEEVVLGPYNPSRESPTFSKDGLHMAVTVPKGSKSVIMVDGVEGPRFDSRVNQIVFSPEGTRHAYVAVSGTDGILVLDGKEVAREPLMDNTPPFFELVFSHGGKRFAYHRHERETKGAYKWLVLDGKQGDKVTAIQNLVFSPDETRFAYLAGHESDTGGQTLVVDGRNVGKQGVDPQFSPDGKTVVTVGHTPTESVLLMNGKAGSRAKSIRSVHMSTGGINLLVLGNRSQGGQGVPGEYLGASGKKIDGSECQTIKWVKFSPDGKRYAALCSSGPGIEYLIVDGKKGEHYQGITDFEFSPDSSRYTYMARGNSGSFRIVDGEESQGYNTYQAFAWGGGGKRFGYVGYGNMIKEGDVVIDGKATKYPGPRNVGFSADGSRSAFVGGDAFFGALYLDGAEQKDVGVIAPSNERASLFAFSSDGKSIAHYGFAGSRDKRGLVANGRLLAEFAQLYTAPLFTPDGQHVFAIVQNPGDGKSHAVLVNGKRVFTLDALPFSSAGGAVSVSPFAMGADGVFTLIGASGGEFKRYRVTASADHTLAKAIADVEAAAAKAIADADAAKKKAADDAAALKKKQEDDRAAAAAKAKADADARTKAAADAAAKRKADAAKAAADRAAKQKK